MMLFGKKIPEFLVILGIVLVGFVLVYRVLPAKIRALILGA